MFRPLFIAVVLAACSGKAADDADYDGIPDVDDCEPDDPSIYPGAPEFAGDGVDSDCDGSDGDLPFVGTWNVVELGAMFSTFQELIPESALGEMVVDEEGLVVMDASSALDPTFTEGIPLTVLMTFEGTASTTPREGGVALYLNGDLDAVLIQETTYADFDCLVVDHIMHCEGTLKALGTTLLTSAVLEKQ